MKKVLLVGLLALVLVAGWLGMRWLGPDYMDVVQPVRGTAVQAVYATGTVEATVMLPLAARVSARLMELVVDEGADVVKDQLLARLEDEDLRQVLNEARTREAYAKKDYDRNAALVKRGVSTRDAFDRALAEWKAAQAAASTAEAKLSFLRIVSPADGRIIRRDGEIGQLIIAGEPVFWLSCCAPLRISAEVDEEDIALVQPGQKVLIHADAFPDKVFHGEVQSITPKGDPIARSYRVRIGFTDENPLLIGMTAETNIVIREIENALLLPSSAVVDGKIWLVVDDKLVRRSVKVGTAGKQQTEIISGIATDDKVVLDPGKKLEEGKKIRTNLVSAEE